MQLPPLYPIVDMGTLQAKGMELEPFTQQLLEGGATLLQLRHKEGTPRQILDEAALISGIIAGTHCTCVMNDRVDLALLAGWPAVHLGHTDLPPEAARAAAGTRALQLGVSTHEDEQVRAADRSSADYVAIGPVFRTGTKADAQAVVGLEGVRRARALTQKPLVAIGGITLENARSVMDAGANSIAVIGGLFREGERVAAVVQDFLGRLR